jgi:hypothetical protein
MTTTIIELRTGRGGLDCGYEFAAGTEYVIYAYVSPYGLVTSSCSGTRDIARAGDDLAFVSTLPALPLTAVEQPVPGLLIGTLLFALAALLAILVAIRRRRRWGSGG